MSRRQCLLALLAVAALAGFGCGRAARESSPPPPPPPLSAAWFPWPPPQWSLRLALPERLLPGGARDLGGVLAQLRPELDRAGLEQWSVYPIAGGGFAVVTRMEHIDGRGRPLAPRFGEGGDRLPGFSILGYLQALMSAEPGRYRVLALLVTDQALPHPGAAPSSAAMNDLATDGPDRLPAPVASQTVTARTRCLALVYEFYRPNLESKPALVRDSRLTAARHLTAAGLFTPQELQP